MSKSLSGVVLAFLVVLAAGCTPGPSAPIRSQPSEPASAIVDARLLMSDLTFLASDSLQGRLIGSPGGAEAARFVEARFRQLGLQGATPDGGFRQEVPVDDGRKGSNVLAEVSGTQFPESVILLTAHYDHLGVRDGEIYNGADDNASGTAALMAMAAYFAEFPPRHTILFAALDGEEGGLRGARALAADPPRPLLSILLNVNMDMVSRDDFGEIWAAGTAHDPWLKPLIEAATVGSAVSLKFGHDTGSGRTNWTGASDHAVFHREGIPFIYFGVDDHDDYHRPTDDSELVEPGFYSGAVNMILSVVRSLDREHEALSAGR